MTTDLVIAEKAIAVAQPEDDLIETSVREHSRLIYRIAWSVLRNPADAEDAVQETFLRALRYQTKMAALDDPKAWLARIAWRVAVERRQKAVRASARDSEPHEELPSLNPGADRALLEKERSALLQRTIASLPDQLRDPLVLSALEELSPREVGTMLGISEAAVRSRAFRARQILRERMAAWMGVSQ